MSIYDDLNSILNIVCTDFLTGISIGMTIGLAIVVIHAYFAYKKIIK